MCISVIMLLVRHLLILLWSYLTYIHSYTYTHTHTYTAADEIPANFLKACKGNVEKAGKKWLATRQWRDENDIGTYGHIHAHTHTHTPLCSHTCPYF